jgi:hypothetical protein
MAYDFLQCAETYETFLKNILTGDETRASFK